MTRRTLAETVAALVAVTDNRISSVTVATIAGHVRLLICWDAWAIDPLKPPAKGVSAWAHERMPDTVADISVNGDVAVAVVACAWSLGAWDIAITTIACPRSQWPPPLSSIEAPDDTPYTTWTFRPMVFAPPIRTRVNASRDATLDRWSLGRSAPPPEVTVRTPAPGASVIITLGQAPTTGETR